MERNLLLFFDRPQEPVFVPKGEQKVIFEVPTNYLVSEKFILLQRPIIFLRILSNASKISNNLWISLVLLD